MAHTIDHETEDFNLVELWLQKDPVRWVAGAISGLIAGGVSIVIGGLIATKAGNEFLFPVKLIGTIPIDSFATEYGMHPLRFAVSLGFYEALAAFAGIFYAHFTRTEKTGFLLSMGATWGIFTWIFWWNLYFQSFRTISDARIPPSAALAICLAYGLSLAVIKVVDPIFRR